MTIPRRANTPAQKSSLLNELLTLWLENPDMRLGQLLENGLLGQLAAYLFYVEDLDLMDTLNRSEHLKHLRDRAPDPVFNPE